jgi:hypothetical protein
LWDRVSDPVEAGKAWLLGAGQIKVASRTIEGTTKKEPSSARRPGQRPGPTPATSRSYVT